MRARDTEWIIYGMKRKPYIRGMVLLCVAYGVVIGLLTTSHAAALPLVTDFGAAVLGVGWSGVVLFTKPDRDERTGEAGGRK